MYIKRSTLEQWIGSDNMNSTYLVSLLLEIINEDYSLIQFQEDVKSYSDEEEE